MSSRTVRCWGDLPPVCQNDPAILAACLEAQLVEDTRAIPMELKEHPTVAAALRSRYKPRYERVAPPHVEETLDRRQLSNSDESVAQFKGTHQSRVSAETPPNWWEGFPVAWKEDPGVAAAVLRRRAVCRHETEFESTRDWALPRWRDLPDACRLEGSVVEAAVSFFQR